MAVITYDFAEYNIVYGGRTLSGFEDGTGVTVARDNDMWTKKNGADGKGIRSKSNDRSGTVTFVLMQGSSDNEFLSEIAAADELTNGGVRTFTMTSQSDTDKFAAETMWIKKVPESPFAKEAGSRTWVLETDDLSVFVGKNKQEGAS